MCYPLLSCCFWCVHGGLVHPLISYVFRTAGYEQWLYVACQFGLVEEYLRLAKHLALNARVDDNGELLNPGTSIQTGGYILDKCLGTWVF